MDRQILPVGYARVGEFKTGLYSRRAKVKVYGILCLVAIVVVLLENYLFPSKLISGMSFLVLIIAFVATIGTHELLHFIPLKIFGLHPKFVFVNIPGYGRCPGLSTIGDYYSRRELFICLLLPQIITIICLLAIITNLSTQLSIILFWVIVLNLLGGISDILTAILIATRHRKSTIYFGESILVTGIFNRATLDGGVI